MTEGELKDPERDRLLSAPPGELVSWYEHTHQTMVVCRISAVQAKIQGKADVASRQWAGYYGAANLLNHIRVEVLNRMGGDTMKELRRRDCLSFIAMTRRKLRCARCHSTGGRGRWLSWYDPAMEARVPDLIESGITLEELKSQLEHFSIYCKKCAKKEGAR